MVSKASPEFARSVAEHSASSIDSSTPAIVEKFVIRLPQGLRDQIRQISEQNRRSMNSEIIMVLEQYIEQMARVEHPDLLEPQGVTTDQELTRRLEALSPDKKTALLSLLT